MEVKDFTPKTEIGHFIFGIVVGAGAILWNKLWGGLFIGILIILFFIYKLL